MHKHKAVILQILAVLMLTSSSIAFAQNESDDTDTFLPVVVSEHEENQNDDPFLQNDTENEDAEQPVQAASFDTTLVGKSSFIFKGVVSGLEYETDVETGVPYTYVTFRQIEPIKDVSGEFASGELDKLRMRLFGGLNEDGTETIMTGIPSFMLGAVYVVFYTSGEWDVSPVVNGENGVFQVIRSRTLGYEMLLDYHGNVVTGIDELGVQTIPLSLSSTHNHKHKIAETGVGQNVRGVQTAGQAVQHDSQFKIAPNSIYSEEAVAKLIPSEQERQFKFEDIAASETSQVNAATIPQEFIRTKMLKELSTQPMSFEAFTQNILSLDKASVGQSRSLSTLRLEGNSVNKVRNAATAK